jgi:hypothetical protein
MEILKRAWSLSFRSEGWMAGYIWLAWGVIGGLVPLWGTAFLLTLLSKDVEPYGLLKNGEFVLYAASFIGGSLFTIRRDVFPNRNFLNLAFYALLGITLLTFAAVTIASLQQAGGQGPIALHISRSALTWISVVVFGLATFLCLLVTVVDASGAGRDVPAALKQDEAKLEAAFTKLEQEGRGPEEHQ